MKLSVSWPYLLGAFALSVALRGGHSTPAAYQPLQAPVTESSETKADEPQIAFAALDYYGAHCARCHGLEGANYSVESLKKRDDASLRAVIHEMAVGPGQAPLEDAQLEAVTAWHRAFIAGQPFVSVTQITRENGKIQLKGEATSEAKITLLGSTVPQVLAERESIHWSAELPENIDLATVQIRADKGETQTLLPLDRARYSHAFAPTE